ncbi:hypothetical protein VMCG_09298 [Cytospora schulzeri]|uniref:Histone chaperone RTT106/FACT complex subunit SPT16-like middle domain-containing protein n=1 Tax=Cytospora schulzeri TaxID=448051 RepID=A0A423VME9_9PEZI|nr:hypothetical protein VMCG_09298 [Valsa malicola]
MATLDNERLGLVFATRPDIIEGIQKAAGMAMNICGNLVTASSAAENEELTYTPEHITLFNSIASFVSEQLQQQQQQPPLHDPPSAEPSAKRRRIDGSEDGAALVENGTKSEHGMLPPPTQSATTGTQQAPASGADSLLIDMANAAAKEVILLEVKEVSVSIPQRKKYDLCFTKNYLYTKQVGTTTPVQGMVYDWSQIGREVKPSQGSQRTRHISNICGTEYVFYAPIPEKSQLQYNYILFPRNTALASTKTFPPADFEPLVFTVPTSAPKPGVIAGYAAQTAAQVSDSYSSLMHWAINSQLQSVGNTTATIVGTDPRVFHSMVRQPHRPNERAVHVKAFRGSKDGYLFFLPNGILWGFKKPLLFLPLDRIVAVSYVNVLQRTFNMVVEVDVSHAPVQEKSPNQQQPGAPWTDDNDDDGMKTEEIEFSMIDQEDYQSIDETYVRRHGLHNRSMAEGRRAKRQLRENAKGAPPVAAGDAASVQGANGEAVVADEDMTELEKAEQMLQDEEDDEEEDYDPGSEGESEGEGDSSEEDDDDDDEDEDDDEAEGYDEEGGEEEGYVEEQE